MRYFVLMVATVFITLSIALPGNPTMVKETQGAAELVNKRAPENLLDLKMEKNKIELTQFIKETENDRHWGKLGKLPFMIYKNIDTYVYVNGFFHETQGEWENNRFYLDKAETIKLFQLEQLTETVFTMVDQTPNRWSLTEPTEEQIYKMMEEMQLPIEGASITKMEGQLPGADRAYRHGRHEGFDWYSGDSGVVIDKETPVYPMFEGTVVRVDKDYVEMSVKERNQLLEDEATIENKKYQKNLDKLRGRQVWIQSENGILIHYAHLDSVNEMLRVGQKVSFEDELGTTGNSGTSNGVLETEEDIHLHTDILINGKNFWEYGNIEEMNEHLIEMFEEK